MRPGINTGERSQSRLCNSIAFFFLLDDPPPPPSTAPPPIIGAVDWCVEGERWRRIETFCICL